MLRGLTFDDVLLCPNYGNVSRDEGSTEASLGEHRRYEIPIIAANMDTICGTEMAVAMANLRGLGILHRFMSIDENVLVYAEARSRVDDLVYNDIGVSVGVGDDEFRRAEALYQAGARLFCVDVAHAHAKLVGKMIKRLRACWDDLFIIAGNVATYAGADYLVGVGADVVKVGLGAGSVCTTREVTGFGVPQLTAIMDCVRVNKPIIADGGIRTSGDVVKALAAGAEMIMLGGMLAGTDEACGDTGRYRGSASSEARMAFTGDPDWRAAEGIAVDVAPKGPVSTVVWNIVEGIKSGLSYGGAKNLEELRRKAVFIEISRAAYVEGTPHGQLG